MITQNQLPTFAGLQQGQPQFPGQPGSNLVSGAGTPPATFASQPSSGGQPQPQWQPPTVPQPNFQPPGFQQQPSPQPQPFPQPNFQQQPNPQPPTQPTWAPPQPQPAAPTLQPEVSPYIQELERSGKLPVGHQFKTDRELIERLWSLGDDLSVQVEEYEKRLKGQQPAPAAAPTAAPVQQAPQAAPAVDVAQMATLFQQSGYLSVQNGQWVALNPMAAAVAEQMNRSALEAQARQAELANPSAFIQKYGADVISKAVDPLNQRLEELTRQNQALQQQFENSIPRPDKDWVNQNRAVLYAKDTLGRETKTQVGAIYESAWNAAYQQYGPNYNEIHKYVAGVMQPLLPNGGQQQQAPRQPWMAGVNNPQSNMYAADPSFTAPGTIFNNGVSPQHQGRPLGNDGMPSFAAIQAHMSQGL